MAEASSSMSLTETLPQDLRAALVADSLGRIKTKFDRSAFLLALQLVDENLVSRDHRQALVTLLHGHIEAGHVDEALEVSSLAAWLRQDLLVRLTSDLTTLTSDQRVLGLQCIRRLLSTETPQQTRYEILASALNLVVSSEKSVAFAAKDIICTILRLNPDSQTATSVRETTEQLLLATTPFSQTLGYTLWLQQLTAAPLSLLPYIHNARYWDHLAHGLQYGDSERRKLCLEVLRLSIQTCVSNGLSSLLSHSNASPVVILSQYSRYLTVFETLTLARYTNLVVEVEADLNRLATTFVVQSRWLYVLLQTALATDMQDQNRKMVGNWILNGSFKPDVTSQEFAHFLQSSFLPWIMEGHLYVSTIQQSDSRTWSCTHGASVTAFVKQTLVATESGPLLDVYLKYILGGRGKIFVHAAVYIMGGIAQSNPSINAEAFANILQLSSWQSLPDLGKELFRRHCWTIVSSEHNSRHLVNTPDELRSQYNALKARFDPDDKDDNEYLSGRESKIRETFRKCSDVREGRISARALADSLDDIWSDIEYLVYPRELLEVVPHALLSQQVLQQISSTEDKSLAEFINKIVQHLLDLADHRSYILAPLIFAIRSATARSPEAASILHLSKYILQVARLPPGAGTDLQFEYANFELLQEQYPSERRSPNNESKGYAAYLSLVSELGQQQSILGEVKNAIISKWKKQKIPPPTLSAFKTTLQLQVLILCCEQLEHSKVELHALLSDLFFLLSIEPLPRYRYLFSWIIIRTIMRYPAEQERVVQQLNTTEHHANPKYLAAVMKLAVELTRAVGTQEYAIGLASKFIALSASSKVVIRHEAQWSFPLLMYLAREKNWTQLCDNPAYQSLDHYIRSLPRFDEPPADRIYSRFDPEQHNTMTNLAQGLWTELDYNGLPLTRREDFEWLNEQEPLQNPQPVQCLVLGEPIDLPGHKRTTSKKQPVPQQTTDEVVALQTKGSAYISSVLGTEVQVKARKHQLIVLASLVTNPYNLGGISRVSEIFGVQALMIGDLKVLTEKDFTSVAVSSHNHISILPLPTGDIATFLSARKAEGWTAVGVEQTDRSDMLGSMQTRLPDKTILILGNEREGMPGEASRGA